MAKEIVDTNFSINLRTLIAISSVLFLMVGEYIILHDEISEAKDMPEPEITKLEFNYNNDKINKSIELNTIEINNLKEKIKLLEK